MLGLFRDRTVIVICIFDGKSDPAFRQLVKWAVASEDARLSRAAMTALTSIDTD